MTRDHEALIRLSDLSVMAGAIDRRSLAAALEWATEHRGTLEHEWSRLDER